MTIHRRIIIALITLGLLIAFAPWSEGRKAEAAGERSSSRDCSGSPRRHEALHDLL